jgi:hypothetical protein
MSGLGLWEILTWASVRTGIGAFGFVANCLRLLFIAGMAVAGIGFVALLGALMLGMLVALLCPFLPSEIQAALGGCDRDPGSLVVAGAIALMLATSFAVTYYRLRAARPNDELFEVVVSAAFSSFDPFFVFTLIAINAFVSIFMTLFALSHWSPFTGPWSPWVEQHERILVMYGMIGSLLAPFPLHFFRMRLRKEKFDKPTFTGSCWLVMGVLLGVGAVVVVVASLAALGIS